MHSREHWIELVNDWKAKKNARCEIELFEGGLIQNSREDEFERRLAVERLAKNRMDEFRSALL